MRDTQPLLLEAPMKEERADMKGMVIVAVLGLIGAFVYAWEPSARVEEPAAAVAVPGNITVPAPQQWTPQNPPPGMIYDPAHNSFHYPAQGAHP